jgi:hypothetical protein
VAGVRGHGDASGDRRDGDNGNDGSGTSHRVQRLRSRPD